MVFEYACFLVLFLQPALTTIPFDPYEDKSLFSISWIHPNDVSDMVSLLSSRYERLEMRTSANEAYTCYIPLSPYTPEEEGLEQSREDSIYFSEILQPFFLTERCHYRVEGYWTYEICHNKHLSQYHKDETKGEKLGAVSSDYFLGYFDTPPDHFNIIPLPRISFNGLSLPYYEVLLGRGSSCDLLGGRAREASVKYICNPNGEHNEFLQIEEISTCFYSIIFGTSFLCRLDVFNTNQLISEEIQCIAEIETAGIGEPISATAVKQESIQYEGFSARKRPVEMEYSDGIPFKQTKRLKVDNMAERFLAGEICLQGGTSGWWKYEFCYKDYVRQFHEDKTTSQEIVLGIWDEKAHIKWFEENESSSKLVSQSTVLHYYIGGEMCQATGKARAVVVKMKCLLSGSMEQVALYLEEPRVCEYQLTVESNLFCDMIRNIGDYGLFQYKKKVEKEKEQF
ncbi:Endoplasmic reticulum lectin 1 [Oopsacas minuta]|uniref:Endoplasmic reticulum lectin 1 n=1 Tax=Oopsacas minuta TaxID=111878 RepID=A0AAV7JD27_9METZ|nr:Endoplasmic reticulum lectin 1 [Oopsacas minuta]